MPWANRLNITTDKFNVAEFQQIGDQSVLRTDDDTNATENFKVKSNRMRESLSINHKDDNYNYFTPISSQDPD